MGVTDLEKQTIKKQSGSKNILDQKKKIQTWLDLSQLDLICPDLIWLDPNWLNLSYKLILSQKFFGARQILGPNSLGSKKVLT